VDEYTIFVPSGEYAGRLDHRMTVAVFVVPFTVVLVNCRLFVPSAFMA
jgi:hypothetical protein